MVINIHVSIGNDETDEWESFKIIPLKELDGSYANDGEIIILPNGEEIKIEMIISSTNLGMSFVLVSEGKTLLNIGCFKQNIENHDPSIVYRTPKGTHLSFMFGK